MERLNVESHALEWTYTVASYFHSIYFNSFFLLAEWNPLLGSEEKKISAVTNILSRLTFLS